MIIDYTVAVECKNPEVYYTCKQCGKCGRKFENGIMIDGGGTTILMKKNRGRSAGMKRYEFFICIFVVFVIGFTLGVMMCKL